MRKSDPAELHEPPIPKGMRRTSAGLVVPARELITSRSFFSRGSAGGGGGGGPDLLLAVDWGTATGTSENAKTDGGILQYEPCGGGPSDDFQVVSATGLGFPAGMANVCKIRMPTAFEDTCWNLQALDLWAYPAIGSSLYRRTYLRFDVLGDGPGDTHWLQSAASDGVSFGDCPYAAEWQIADHDNASTFKWKLSCLGDNGACSPTSECHEWELPAPLNKNQTYRIEEQFYRRVSAGWKCKIRIYTADNNLLYDEDDIICPGGYHAGSHSMTTHFNGSSGINGDIVTDTNCLRRLMFGQPNAPGRLSSDSAHESIWVGGLAIAHGSVDTGWIGAYVPGEGP